MSPEFDKFLYISDNTVRKEPNLVHIVNILLDHFQTCQKLDFKPNSTLIQSLEEMGFEKQQVLETLKITGNNQANAVSNTMFTRITIKLYNINKIVH